VRVSNAKSSSNPIPAGSRYAVVSFDGFLGTGEKLFAIPFSSFVHKVEKNEKAPDIAKERLKGAPGFDADHWPSTAEERWNRDVYKYYGRSPYWKQRPSSRHPDQAGKRGGWGLACDFTVYIFG
jgi:hypothetical protein